MNQASPTDALRTGLVEDKEDKLDRALSDFFKSKMKEPWPSAPATPSTLARMPVSEPALLVASRGASSSTETPRNQPTAESGSKSRYTLAMSVAALLGSCWLLSNGFQPGERPGPGGNGSPKIDFFAPAGASNPAAVQEHQKDNAEKGNQGVKPRNPLPWDWQQVK